VTHHSLTYVLHHLEQLAGGRAAREAGDAELLGRFLAKRDEAAFATLVRRHGPMVLGTCHRLLGDAALAEDAFQATFLVLVRRAAAIRKPTSLASWLYGVARRIAGKARAQANRRRTREREMTDMPSALARDETSWHELRAVLDEEVERLPEPYRTAVLLCYFEGKSHAEAARALGCPRTSLTSRLGRARLLLRQRLTRRGLALSTGTLATALTAEASAVPVPATLLLSTTRAACLLAAGKATAAAAVAPHAAALAQGVTQAMSASKMIGAIALTTALVLGAAAAGLTSRPVDPGAVQQQLTGGPNRPRAALFRDVTRESGVRFTYRNGEEAGLYTPLETLGGGVALLDYDGDGLLDVFIVGGGSFDKTEAEWEKDRSKPPRIHGRPCKLYKNMGGWKFKDVTHEAGLDHLAGGQPFFYTHGCAVADYDCDGWPDLLVTGYGGLALFHNEPDGKGGRHFVDVTKKAGLGGRGSVWCTSAAWADLDGDGYPELYVCQYTDWSFANHPTCKLDGITRDVCPPKQFAAQPHLLYQNRRDGTFTEVGALVGLRTPPTPENDYGKGLGVVIVDVDGDGKPDIFIANDTTGNFLYRNRSTPGRISLEEIALLAGVARDDRGVPTGSRGVAAADYDDSGRPSLWVANYEHELSALYRNETTRLGPVFRFRTHVAGIAVLGQANVGWGTGFLDVDNDGWQDLVMVTGHDLHHPVHGQRRQRPVLLHNDGKGKFTAVGAEAGPYFRTEHLGRGLAIGDLDNDGRADLVISHLNQPVVLLRNEAPRTHWLGIELAGAKHHDVVGARVVVEAGGRTLTRFATSGGSYLSSGDRRLLFGLGKADKIDRVRVIWPSRKEQQWKGADLPIDRYWRLVEGQDRPERRN
jgi:RNA polymerase sigma factor (sigma-70 family)